MIRKEINDTLKQILITDYDVNSNRRKIKGQLPLEHIFVLCKTFEKITKQLGFHLTFKTADLQDIIYTTLANNITVTI